MRGGSGPTHTSGQWLWRRGQAGRRGAQRVTTGGGNDWEHHRQQLMLASLRSHPQPTHPRSAPTCRHMPGCGAGAVAPRRAPAPTESTRGAPGGRAQRPTGRCPGAAEERACGPPSRPSSWKDARMGRHGLQWSGNEACRQSSVRVKCTRLGSPKQVEAQRTDRRLSFRKKPRQHSEVLITL